jgi:signal transduction histidine kinase
MNFGIIFVILAALVNFIIGVFTYQKNPKSSTNKLFFGFTLSLISYLFINYLALNQSTDHKTLIAIRIVMTNAIIVNFLFFLLVSSFPKNKIGLKPIIIWSSVVFTIAMIPLTLSSFVFNSVTPGTTQPNPGVGIPLFGLHTLIFIGGGILYLFNKFKKSVGIEKSQLRLLLFGALLMFCAIITTNFLFVIFLETTNFVSLLPFYLTFFAITIAYAIIRHRFLDISLLVARTVSYSLLLFVLLLVYTSLIFTLTEFIPVAINHTFIYAAMAIVVAFSFDPIKRFLETTTDRFLFKGRYNTEELLGQLTQIMASEIDIERLSQRLMSSLKEKMRLTKGAFILVNKNAVSAVESNGFDSEIPLADNKLAEIAYGEEKTFIFEELPSDGLKDLFRRLDLSIAIPLRVKENPIGLLVLGPKASGEIYSGQDIELLEIFAPQAAVALQNTQSFREIQELTRTLEERVEDRTRELKETQVRELDKAKELLRIKDEFVFIATHDLRTPVTAIRGYIDLIETSGLKFDENNHENFEAIKDASNRLNQLVNDLLEVARSESGTIKIVPQPINIINIIENSLKQVTPESQKKNLTMNREFDTENPMVNGDEEKLAEVLENLLSNAVKFSKDDGYVTVRTEKEDDMLYVEVEDTGYGIPKDKQDSIFQKFVKVRTDDTKGVPGTGLGLFVVRMLVEKMHGSIDFDSEEGKGTKFFFRIPLATNEKVAEEKVAKSEDQ